MAVSPVTDFWLPWVIKHPRLTLVLLTLLTLVAAAGLPRFKLDASADSLTLERDKDLEFFREVTQKFGAGDFLVITYHPKTDLFGDEALAHLRSLQDELARVPGVANVNSILTVPLLASPKQSLREISNEPRTLETPGTDRIMARREFLTSPLYRELILSPDGQTTALQLSLAVDQQLTALVTERDHLRNKRHEEGLTDTEQARLDDVSEQYRSLRTAADAQAHTRVDRVREVVGRHKDHANIFVGGVSMITADMIDFIRSDLVVFGTASFLFMVAMLAIIFRNLRFVLIPVASCVMSIVMMLGFLAWVDWRLTVISSNFVALLMILSLTVTMHLVMRYREYAEENPSWTREQLLRATLSFMAMPSWNNTLTTVVAFASFVTSGIRPLIDFGWMMSIGLMVALLLSFVTLPAFLMMLPKEKIKPQQAKSLLTKKRTSISSYCAVVIEKFGIWIFWGGLLAGALSFWGISKLEVENRFIDYFHEETEIHQGLALIDDKLGGTTTLDIVITPKPDSATDTQMADDPFAEEEIAEEDPFGDTSQEESSGGTSAWFTLAGMEYIERIHDHLETLPEVGKVQSLATLYKVGNDINGGLNNFELAVLEKSLPLSARQILLDPFLDHTTDQTRITMRVKDSYPELRRAELLQRIEADVAKIQGGIEVEKIQYSGLLVLYNNMLQSLYDSQISTLAWSFVIIFIMFIILLRSLLVSIVATVPTAISAALILGGMGFVGIQLDMMTITIASITVGIGVDNTIHYLARFKEELQKDGDYIATMHRSHATIGNAIFHTNNIIVFGFSILVLSEFIPTIYFGALTGIAMLTALGGTLFFLPQLILLARPFPVSQNPTVPSEA
jgi:predicted RND superfamily exporter protein